MPECQKVKSAV